METDYRGDDAYFKMLEEAYKKIPKEGLRKEVSRFKIPRVRIFYHGKNRTIFLNFLEIAQMLNRDPNLLRRFLSRELASPSSPSGNRLIFHARIDETTLQNTIEYFIRKYVKCPICGGYDTRLLKVDRHLVIKCDICGAESPVPPIK
jgi:translation initiation factor 2 subunit 2